MNGTVEELRKHGKVNSYIVMPRYGVNVADLYIQRHCFFSVSSVLDLGCRVIEQLRGVHKAGYTYNDLKPDNIMVEFSEDSLLSDLSPQGGNIFEGVNLHLIDFGFVADYKDRTSGKLLPRKVLPKFTGNLRYASPDQLAFRSTGRKDDLVSLLYMMVVLLTKGH